uniref:Helicase C-terminal domain-containing protein n=1 Tax=Macrostomum lignano TaxID=282301 RepID=A0A1I8GGQ2_9PLAT
ATVVQRGEAFSKRSVQHCHLPLHRPVERARLKRRIVDCAQKNPFLSAVQIAKEETLDVLQQFQTGPSMPNPNLLALTANRQRKNERSEERNDLQFELQENALPAGFLQRDVHSGARRRIIFATNEGLTMLAQAQDWFMDGTFR